ncbi:MAG TPA: GNAT family protein [Roseiflexaceae bacterium]|nr:GNAT family protein [Roseiflexaceae bacterium]
MLKGERVTLRAVERDDLKRLHELQRNVDLVLLGDGEWQPQPLAAREQWFDKHVLDEDKAWFVIEVDGTLIGDLNLHHRDRRSRVSAFGIAIYDPAYLGQGYGREAIGLLLDWAFRIQNYERIWLDTWANNQRALRCYKSLGFVEEGRQRRHLFVNGEYIDVVLMGLLRDEWEAGRSQGQGDKETRR